MTSEPVSDLLFDRQALHPNALQTLDESAQRSERWLVAFSGGADSLGLLLTVLALWPEQKSRVVAAHFNHALRGTESDADENFCAQIAAEKSLTFVSERWARSPLSADAGANEHASEADARAARFEFFSKLARERDCRVLLTGHHLNDVLETFFMRLARGASSAGLAAPRPVRVWSDDEHTATAIVSRLIVRPLLSVTGEEIRARLAAAGRKWREDASNQQADFFRNRIRREVVPAWLQAAGPSALAGMALTRGWLEDDDSALESWLDELGIQKTVTTLPLALLAGKPRALRRRALRRWRGSEGLAGAGFELLVQLSEEGVGQMSIGDGYASIEDGILIWKDQVGEKSFSFGSVCVGDEAYVYLPDGSVLRVRALETVADWQARLAAKAIDQRTEAFIAIEAKEVGSANPFRLTIRFWRPGDRYSPLGLGGSAKLQDLFVNRKFDADFRRRIPVISGPDDQIVWVPGFPPAEKSRLHATSESGVQLTYIPGTSTVSQQSLFP